MKTKSRKMDEGFSFAETIASIAIMLILTAGAAVTAFKIIDQAKIVSVKTQIETYKLALHSYYLDCGNFPNEEQGLQALYSKPVISPVSARWNGPYVDKEIQKDPWGNEYVYKTVNDYGLAFVIYSLGSDGITGGEGNNEDIVSWK
ncbi:MAG TPA: type II secretion system major pseudopilin GspG [Treponemataceae bacterium]|nr:type II secretion system major pseudopilin GspG [Treponemataceae bacterium]HQL04797.1 type II secretion system major pseudopilin GspG [Treponemataceae bacterium]